VTPDRVRSFIVDRVLLVDSLRVNLKHVLQERLNILEQKLLDTRGEVARLREQSRERYEATLASDDATAEQRSQTEADYENIQAELEDIERLLDSVGNQLSDLRNFRRELVEDVAVQLSAMGTPGS
jgi:DNA repair exonuclease SbcCD ATPase subunit